MEVSKSDLLCEGLRKKREGNGNDTTKIPLHPTTCTLRTEELHVVDVPSDILPPPPGSEVIAAFEGIWGGGGHISHTCMHTQVHIFINK